MLKRLPVLFIYENNQFSVCSRSTSRYPGEIIFHATPHDLMFTRTVDGNAVLEVHEAAKQAVDRARSGQGPSFIECKTYRMRGHAGAGSDEKLGYRSAAEIAAWEERCPVKRSRDFLVARRAITDAEMRNMEEAIDREIDEAFLFARKSPLPDRRDLLLHLFRE